MTKKILIATGGTGGHIYPAVALAQQIEQEMPDSKVLFIGGGLAENRYFDRNAFASRTIACGAFINKSPLAIAKTLWNIGRGVRQSQKIISEFCPDIAVGFGSFYSFPPLVAAKLMAIPIVLHESNSIPGKVNRLLSKYAVVSAVQFPQTKSLLQGNSIEVAMPLRTGFKRQQCSQREARCWYGLHPERPVILIFGGSQGAQAINAMACEAIKGLCQDHPVQVLHLIGASSSMKQWEEQYSQCGISAVVKPFESQMAMAWQAADIVIARAGAGTIAEQLEFEVPGILIPFARAADNHQEHNADFMADTVGGAVKILEHCLDAQSLTNQILNLLEPNIATRMREAMSCYKKKVIMRDLCSIVKEII